MQGSRRALSSGAAHDYEQQKVFCLLFPLSMDAIQKVQDDIRKVEDEITQVKSQLDKVEPAERQHFWKELSQLRTKEEQLRAEKMLLLQPAGASSSSLNLCGCCRELAGKHATLYGELLKRPVPG